MKDNLAPEVMKAFEHLAAENDIIVIEGAGSPAEINLAENDIVNMGMAKMANARSSWWRTSTGAASFASAYGTVKLLPQEDQDRFCGIVINKFRGDVEILKPGLKMLEDLTGKPVLGVLPMEKIDVDDEDSLSDRLNQRTFTEGIDVAVIRLPHISNFTDFSVFELIDGVSLRYVTDKRELGDPDLILLPGTKNTMADMEWLIESGLEGKIIRAAETTRIIGICGVSRYLEKNFTTRTMWSMAAVCAASVCWIPPQSSRAERPGRGSTERSGRSATFITWKTASWKDTRSTMGANYQSGRRRADDRAVGRQNGRLHDAGRPHLGQLPPRHL